MPVGFNFKLGWRHRIRIYLVLHLTPEKFGMQIHPHLTFTWNAWKWIHLANRMQTCMHLPYINSSSSILFWPWKVVGLILYMWSDWIDDAFFYTKPSLVAGVTLKMSHAELNLNKFTKSNGGRRNCMKNYLHRHYGKMQLTGTGAGPHYLTLDVFAKRSQLWGQCQVNWWIITFSQKFYLSHRPCFQERAKINDC